MKKNKFAILMLVAMLALSACTFSFSIDGKEVITGQADKQAIADAICLTCSETEGSLTEIDEDEGEQIELEECGYDYTLMPIGHDSLGIPLADYGIDLRGKEVVGPALVQIDSLAVIYVLPGQTYDVVKGTTWVYTGDEACLRSQFVFYPGKQFFPVPTP